MVNISFILFSNNLQLGEVYTDIAYTPEPNKFSKSLTVPLLIDHIYFSTLWTIFVYFKYLLYIMKKVLEALFLHHMEITAEMSEILCIGAVKG